MYTKEFETNVCTVGYTYTLSMSLNWTVTSFEERTLKNS